MYKDKTKLLIAGGLVALLIILVLGSLFGFYYLYTQRIDAQRKSVESDSKNKIETKTLKLINNQNQKILKVEIADTNEERLKGLMNRQNLEDSDGMLFIFDAKDNLAFWMKDTHIPLDIIFFDESREFVNVAKDTSPCIGKSVCENYLSESPSKYVLETKAGFIPEEYFDENLKFELE